MSDGYDGPERRQDSLELERRLTKLETTLDYTRVGVDELSDSLSLFKRDLFSRLDRLSGKVDRNDTDIVWLKGMVWKVLAGATALSGLAAYLVKRL